MILRKIALLLAVATLHMFHGNLSADCDGCSRADCIFRLLDDDPAAIAAGISTGTGGAPVTGTGTTGTGGLAGNFVIDHIFAFNDATSPLTLAAGAGVEVPFNNGVQPGPGPALTAGSGITQTSLTTFTLHKTGHYSATFVGNGLSGGVGGAGYTFTLNGAPQSITATAGAVNSTTVLQQILNVTTVPTTLAVEITGPLAANVVLIAGTSATLTVDLLSTP